MIIFFNKRIVAREEEDFFIGDGTGKSTGIFNAIGEAALGVTAEEICEGILRYQLLDFTTVPETVKQAVLYDVYIMYENRDNFETKEVLEIMIRLLFFYRRESW